MIHGTIVTCTEFDSVRVEIQTEGRGLTIPSKTILAMDAILTKCRQRQGTLEIKPVLLSGKTSWTAGFHEEMPGESAEYSAAGGSTPWAAVLALAEMLR